MAMLLIAPEAADAARICKNGHLHYGGSAFHADRAEAQASAIDAWRRIKAGEGTARASRMSPPLEQVHCERATTGEGWRCFVRGGPCHHA
ncbi:MAG: hypothetical protein JO084_06305 [Bradyrhizobiaceae bacterium]|nr:hypothetical protein [Bradyrhizobiaceae bacterium]